ncbi:hypothetical protein BDQ17DRAFT_1431422 [Cyathus striatus]|nr:hypothetical protein BDQ17DRAFT_1431422 [Cyathus striatus]
MSSEQQASDIKINVKGPSELKLQITISPDKTVLELKEAIAEKSDVEAERQRLIYSGRVLKDDDQLSVYKIQSTHTIHMVKGAAKSGAASTSTSATSQPLPAMQAGQNVHDPLTQLNSHLGYGAMAGLNPFQDMGLNQNDPNMLQSMFSNPNFMQQMSAMLQNPGVIDQLIASNPQLQSMAPQVRQMFQSEHFRNMLSDPQRLQSMLQMAQMMQGAGGGSPFGGLGGGGGLFAPPPSFPAPGVPGSNPTTNITPSSPSTGTTAPGTNANAGAPAPPPFDPFALFGAPPAGGAAPGGTTGAAPNPLGFDPAAFREMLGGGLGGFGAPPTPADTRPPEERFQVQLQQLQDMGFSNASQNVRALLATGGNVHSAIEYILGGGGL